MTYAERRVIQLARVYVSLKRVFLDRAGYAGTRRDATTRYHERNVIAYPQNPDKLAVLVGLMPKDLCNALTVQFVGNDRTRLRHEPALAVCVERLRAAFAWLATNCWPWMQATKYSDVRTKEDLGEHLESLLAAYAQSVGETGQGVPSELIQGATRIPEGVASVQQAGPADAVMAEEEDDAADKQPVDDCAAVLDGGIDDISPFQLWDEVMRRYGVAQECERAIARFEAASDPS